MSLIPDTELKQARSINMAPMVDLLFILLAVIVVGFITRAAIFDTEFNLVKAKKTDAPSLPTQSALKGAIIKVFENGTFTLFFDGAETSYNNVDEMLTSLTQLRDSDKISTNDPLLLKIEKNARWEPIAEVILKAKQEGYIVRPLYEQDSSASE